MQNKSIMAAMAPAFNMLLGIEPGHFGRSAKTGPGAGTLRREKREAEYREKEARRTANAAPAKITRQQRRRENMPAIRRARKNAIRAAAGRA